MIEADRDPSDSRTGDGIDVVERKESVKARLRRDMDQTVRLQLRMACQGFSHGGFDIGIPQWQDSQDEVAAGGSGDLGPDPVEGMGIVGSQIRFCFAVGYDSETSGGGASGQEKSSQSE